MNYLQDFFYDRRRARGHIDYIIMGLRKELEELKNSEQHIESGVISSIDPKDNFMELQSLSQRTNSRFKIIGDHYNFSLTMFDPGVYVLLGCYLIWLAFLTFIIIQNPDSIFAWTAASILALLTLWL